MTKSLSLETDLSTEERIKEAAQKVFLKKGYSATRTRDIAEEAGINLAMLNYYFRSKEKLFQLVMSEKVELMFGMLAPIANDKESDLETKLNDLISIYMDMLSENPDLPLFVLSEVKNNQDHFKGQSSLTETLACSNLIQQLNEERPDFNPNQFLMNIMSLCVFPYVVQPLFNTAGLMNDGEFKDLMDERKRLIPIWTKTLLNCKE